MEKIEIKFFKTLKVHGRPVKVVLSHTEDFILAAVPGWNWSFLWEVARDNKEVKMMLQSALITTHYINLKTAERFSEELYQYLLEKGYEV